jgi:hypothetical protein
VNINFDVRNLRHDANYKVLISNDLYWVPINILGKTRFPNEHFIKMVHLAHINIQDKIGNVYEAAQFLNALSFAETKDVYYVVEDGLRWEYHIDGETAIKNRSGCCTSVASAINFLVKKCYPYMGYLFFVRRDTSNHALNYIHYNNRYYIFDASAFTYGNVEDIALENGDKLQLRDKILSSFCFETKELKSFVKYYSRVYLYNNNRFIFFDFPKADNCITKAVFENTGAYVNIYLPKNTRHNIVGATNDDIYKIKLA